jgi:cytochrome c oxidase assembly factor CtaG
MRLVVPLLLAAAACAGYVIAAGRAGASARRSAAFVAGVAGAGCVVAWDPASLPAHMVQHGLLTTVAAPLIVLGEPIVLVLRLVSARHRRALVRSARRVQPLLGAWAGLCAFVGVQWLAHWPALVAGAEAHPLLHAALHAALLGSAVVFFLPILGRQPVPRRLPSTRAVLQLVAAISLVDLVTVPYLATGRGGAAAAMLAAMSPLGIVALLVAWQGLAQEERRMLRREALP